MNRESLLPQQQLLPPPDTTESLESGSTPDTTTSTPDTTESLESVTTPDNTESAPDSDSSGTDPTSEAPSTSASPLPPSQATVSTTSNQGSPLQQLVQSLKTVNTNSVDIKKLLDKISTTDKQHQDDIQWIHKLIDSCPCSFLTSDTSFVVEAVALVSAGISLFSFVVNIYLLYRKVPTTIERVYHRDPPVNPSYEPSAPGQENIPMLNRVNLTVT